MTNAAEGEWGGGRGKVEEGKEEMDRVEGRVMVVCLCTGLCTHCPSGI